MEKSEIPEIINFMNALYPNRKLKDDDVTKNVWYEMLGEFKKEDVKKAIKDIANSQCYIPNLPEIVKRIQPSFLVEIDSFGNTYAVYIRFPESMFPFRFNDKQKANSFLQMIKKRKPDIETITDLFSIHVRERKGILREEARQNGKIQFNN